MKGGNIRKKVGIIYRNTKRCVCVCSVLFANKGIYINTQHLEEDSSCWGLARAPVLGDAVELLWL